MSRVQDATFRCDCGQEAPVTPVTAYEFDVVCACGWAYRLSWAHRDAPPVFAPDMRRPARAVELYATLPWDGGDDDAAA